MTQNDPFLSPGHKYRLDTNTKTKAMMISRKRQPPTLTLIIEGVLIQSVNTFKYLGVILSNNLT